MHLQSQFLTYLKYTDIHFIHLNTCINLKRGCCKKFDLNPSSELCVYVKVKYTISCFQSTLVGLFTAKANWFSSTYSCLKEMITSKQIYQLVTVFNTNNLRLVIWNMECSFKRKSKKGLSKQRGFLFGSHIYWYFRPDISKSFQTAFHKEEGKYQHFI